MPHRTSKRELKRMKEEQGYRGRSATYRYVRLNLARFQEIGIGTNDGPTWEAFAALLTREQQTNKQGGRLGPDSARRIFERANKDARAEQATQVSARQRRDAQPSRLPATWKPTPAEPPRAPPAPRVEPRHHTGSPPLREEDLPEDVRANLAALDSQFAWADRFVNPPKKKDR